MLRGAWRALLRSRGGIVGGYDAIANIVHVYEPARCTLAAYEGQPLVRLRRASDDDEADFTNVSAFDLELDLAAIAAWAGGASYLVTIYDQVGNDDVGERPDVEQPLFTADAQNGHAGGTYDGTNDLGRGAITNSGALSQPFSVYAIAQLDVSAVNDGQWRSIIDGYDLTNRLTAGVNRTATPDAWRINAGGEVTGGDNDSNWNIWSMLFSGASSEFWLNGVSEAAGNAGAHNADGLTIGTSYAGTMWWKGLITSVVIVDPAHSDSQRLAMQTAMNSYWGVY